MDVYKYNKNREDLYRERVVCLNSKSVFVFEITSDDLLGILYRIYMFHLFKKDFKSKEDKENERRNRR